MPQHTAAKRAAKRRVSRKIKVLKKEGKPQKQAVAIALTRSRKRKK